MVQRSPPKSKVDDGRFPIRLKFKLPSTGSRWGEWRVANWLREELGDHDSAAHAMGHDQAVYFRKLADAQRFVDAFPELPLADGVAEEYGIRKPPMPYQGHAIRNGWKPFGEN
jgi:hypothetical protein